MTLAEKLRDEGQLEGKLEGLKDAIELGMTLKFPADADTVMAEVTQITDIDTLMKLKETIKTAKNNAEILTIVKGD